MATLKVRINTQGVVFIHGGCENMVYLPTRNGGTGEIALLTQARISTKVGRVQYTEEVGFLFYQDTRYGLDNESAEKLAVFLGELNKEYNKLVEEVGALWAGRGV